MKTKRDLFNARVDKSHLTINHFKDYALHEVKIGSKTIVGKVSDSRKFHVPWFPSLSVVGVVVPFNLVDWNLVWNENKVYNFYYSLPFKDRRRRYK